MIRDPSSNVKLDTTLFNAVLEQVKKEGPDPDCRCESDQGPFKMFENGVYEKFLNTSVAYMAHQPMAAFHTMFYMGFECGLQYAKVAKEVKELNRMVGGEG